MKTVQVCFNVKKDFISDFVFYTNENVLDSKREQGVVLFNFFQDNINKTVFYLLECYKTQEDQLLHRET